MKKFSWLILAFLGVFVLGVFGREKIESLGLIKWFSKDKIAGDEVVRDKNNNTGGDNTAGDKTGGNKSGNAGNDSIAGNKTGDVTGDNTGRDKVEGDNLGGDSTKVSVNAQPGSTVNITPGNPQYDNDKQPNISDKFSDSKPVELSRFKSAMPLTKDTLLENYDEYIYPDGREILINKRPFNGLFRLQGYGETRTAAFRLNGTQKAVFIQLGLSDLPQRRNDSLIYDVTVTASNSTSMKKVWSGKVVYGSKEQQIVSLPFEASGMTRLVIDYTVTQGNDTRPLYITRAESLLEN